MEFEARKVVSRVFRNMLIRQIGTRYPTVSHIAENKDIIFFFFLWSHCESRNVSMLQKIDLGLRIVEAFPKKQERGI